MSTSSVLVADPPYQREKLIISMRRHRLRAESLEARRLTARSERTLARIDRVISAHRLRVAYLLYLVSKVRA